MSDDPQAEEDVKGVQEKGKDAEKQNKALDALTDRVEEKELDTSKLQGAVDLLTTEKQPEKPRPPAAVKLRQEDIALLASELDLDKKAAELRLREAGGDVRTVLERVLAC